MTACNNSTRYTETKLADQVEARLDKMRSEKMCINEYKIIAEKAIRLNTKWTGDNYDEQKHMVCGFNWTSTKPATYCPGCGRHLKLEMTQHEVMEECMVGLTHQDGDGRSRDLERSKEPYSDPLILPAGATLTKLSTQTSDIVFNTTGCRYARTRKVAGEWKMEGSIDGKRWAVLRIESVNKFPNALSWLDGFQDAVTPAPSKIVGYSPIAAAAKWMAIDKEIDKSRWATFQLSAKDMDRDGGIVESDPNPDSTIKTNFHYDGCDFKVLSVTAHKIDGSQTVIVNGMVDLTDPSTNPGPIVPKEEEEKKIEIGGQVFPLDDQCKIMTVETLNDKQASCRWTKPSGLIVREKFDLDVLRTI